MTIHDMLLQIALFSSGAYERRGELSSLRVPLPDGRHQVIFGRHQRRDGEKLGVLYTRVGMRGEGIDPWELLAMNAHLRHTRVTTSGGDTIILLALFDMDHTSIKECAPILQEMAAVADELENRYFQNDTN